MPKLIGSNCIDSDEQIIKSVDRNNVAKYKELINYIWKIKHEKL